MFLTDAELSDLTGYMRKADQRKWLKARGWRFEVSAGGRPIVSRNYVDKQLGVESTSIASAPKKSEWKPNIAAIKKAA